MYKLLPKIQYKKDQILNNKQISGDTVIGQWFNGVMRTCCYIEISYHCQRCDSDTEIKARISQATLNFIKLKNLLFSQNLNISFTSKS